MRIVADDGPLAANLRGASFALGNFDGVHRGHQQVIADAVANARAHGRIAGAAVFEPHPRQFLHPDGPPFRLQSPGQRARALAALGVELIVEIRFDARVAASSDAEFVRAVLRERLGAAHVSVGADFTFGRDRVGDVASLRRLGAQYGFTVFAAPMVGGAAKVSSSTIRAALSQGRMKDAVDLLGRPWAVEGLVLPGDARGRTIGFPTLNIALGAYQPPRMGVYAVRAQIDDGPTHAGVANFGVRPSFGGGAPLLETHLFDFDRDLYGHRIEVALVRFIRPEMKFDGVEALKTQIARDVEEAKAALL